MGTQPVARRRTALVVLLALVGVLVIVVAAGSLPAVCSGCHGSLASAVERGTHASVSCYDCHLDNGAWGFPAQKNTELTRMYPTALSGAGLKRPARMTARSACLECHSDVLKGVTSGDGLSIKHRVCAPEATCDGCHSTVGHGDTVRWAMNPSMEDCVACHNEKNVSSECETCHTSEPAERRNIKGPWQVTHGPNWQKTHGMGDQSSCGTCHPSNFCEKCHGVPVPHGVDFGARHGAYAMKDKSACVTCHKSEQKFCLECHGMEMPHPEEFTKQHSKIAKSTSDERCILCHVDTDCGQCHDYHVHPGGSEGVPVPWDYTPEELRP